MIFLHDGNQYGASLKIENRGVPVMDQWVKNLIRIHEGLAQVG